MEEDAFLPKATINSFVKEVLNNQKATQEFSDLILNIATEYIKKVSADANRLCLKDGKKTISHDFVFRALNDIGFDKYYAKLEEEHNQYLDEFQKSKSKSKNLYNKDNLDELDAEQQKLLKISSISSSPLDNLDNFEKPDFNTKKNFTLNSIRAETGTLNPFEEKNKDDDDDYDNFN